MHELPAEIWIMIVEELPRASQRSCLSVSRLLHDIAIRPLFYSMKVYLHRHEDDNTRDILNRIVSDRTFAISVKRLVVIEIFSSYREPWTVKTRALAKAIESMSQLVAFQWLGRTMFLDDISKAIVSFCPQLRELTLPLNFYDHSYPLGLHNLRALRASWHPFTRSAIHLPRIEIDDGFDLDGYLRLIDANEDTLQELHFIATYLDKVPVRIFDSLTHLEIYVPDVNSGNLCFVFCHADRLESLALTGYLRLPLLYLAKNMDILPRLSSLQLVNKAHWSPADIVNLLRRRVSLRRLYLYLPTYCLSDSCEILSIIKDLPLRVLGLDIALHIHKETDLESLALHLPPTLESLQLTLPWFPHTSFVPLRGVLESLPNLTFLHLFSHYTNIPMTAQEMAHHMKHLRIVGHQESLWDIARAGNDETLLPLSVLKAQTLRAELEGSFANDSEDWTWLLKYF